ncbi:MAG: PAS domain S-box protein [bacterium]|nr:PAS domain S-box protein [bacterium]
MKTEESNELDALEALRGSWELTLDAIPDLVAIIDRGHKIVRVNRAMAERLGSSAEQCIGASCCSLIHGTEEPPNSCPHARMLKDGHPHREEFSGGSLDGEWVFSVSPLLADDGSVAGCIHVMHDVTEERRTRELLELRNGMCAALASSGDLTATLERILDGVLEIDGIDCGGIYLVDRITGGLELPAHRGLPVDFLARVRSYDSTAPEVKIVAAGTPVYSSYAQMSRKNGLSGEGNEIRGIAAVPFVFDGRVIGSLNVGSLTRDEIPPHIRTSLEAIALQISGAIVRVQMQEELRQNRRDLESLFETLDDFLFVFDINGRVVNCNSALSDRLGYSRIEASQLTVPKLHPAEVAVEARQALKDMIAGEISSYSLPLTAKSGEVIPVETKVARAYWGDQTVLIAIAHDLSRLRRADKTRRALSQISEAVFESRDLYTLIESIHRTLNTLIDVANFFVAIYDDKEGVYTFPYYSDEKENLEDFEDPDPLTGSLTDFVRRSAQPMLWTKELDADLRARAEIGEVVGVPSESWAGVPLFDPQDRVFGVMVVQSYTDPGCYSEDDLALLVVASSQIAVAVERKRAEEALHEHESRLRSIFRAAPVGIGLVSNRSLKEVNERLCEMVGYSAEELQDQSARMLYLSEEDFLYVGETKYDQIRENGTGTVETQWKRKDGRIIDVILSSTPLDSDDWSLGVTFIAMDITDRKQAEEERLQFERQLQHAQKLESLGVLAGGIAHDFNNLLVGILGNADIALLELPPSSPTRINVEEIEKTAGRAAELCKQMLAYSGKGRFVVDPIDLSALVEEMVHLLHASISKKAVLKLQLGSNLPAVEADATQLRQVVMNLITNASEALGEGAGEISVMTGVKECSWQYLGDSHTAADLIEGRYIYLEVADTGCGMDELTAEKIFDPFFTTKFSGRGLGLAAVQGIVYGHDGAVRVDSEPDRGTSITILLPASNRLAIGSGGAEQMNEDWAGEGTVLLVDDDEAVRAVARQMLEMLGFTIVEAKDGRASIDVFEERSDEIVLVLLDMTMPRMDGQETFLEMTRRGLKAPVVLSSGHDEQDATRRLAGKGLAGFIQKPYRLDDLRTKVRAVLEGETLSGAQSRVTTVLIVDDDEDLVILTEQSLKVLGYEVETATQGETAVEIIKQRGAEISVVLLDITMPGMSGRDVLPLIMEESPTTKVIIFSGRGLDSKAQELLDSGADSFLHKTLSRTELNAAIQSVLDENDD